MIEKTKFVELVGDAKEYNDIDDGGLFSKHPDFPPLWLMAIALIVILLIMRHEHAEELKEQKQRDKLKEELKSQEDSGEN